MKNKFKIEERRRQVASLFAQSKTESEIAQKLNVDQSTISRDIKALKQMSQQSFNIGVISSPSFCAIVAGSISILGESQGKGLGSSKTCALLPNG